MTLHKPFVKALLASVVISSIPVIQRLFLAPLYFGGGVADRLLGPVNRLSAMLLLPGKFIVYKFSPPVDHYFSTPQLLCAACVNLVIYFVLAGVAFRLFKKPKQSTSHEAVDEVAFPAVEEIPVSPGRRSFLKTATTTGAGLTIIALSTYPVLVAPGKLKVRRVSVPIKDLAPGLNNLTIAHLTDFHHDEWISLHHIRESVMLANSLQPDIVALTGDYVTSNPALIKPCILELANLRPKIGTLAVLGNHDWWSDPVETRKHLASTGASVIDNGRMFVDGQRRLQSAADSGICIGGVGDFWEDEIEPDRAFHNVSAALPRVLLSHNPDVAEHSSVGDGSQRVDLMLSGHTHGGQVRLPFMGTPIVPSSYGSKYAQGLVDGPSCPVQISAGIGLALLPVRFNVQPEIVLITLKSA